MLDMLMQHVVTIYYLLCPPVFATAVVGHGVLRAAVGRMYEGSIV